LGSTPNLWQTPYNNVMHAKPDLRVLFSACRSMYLRFDTQLEFPQLANLLRPGIAEDSLVWDYENVYEWMYIDLPTIEFSLNVSREHGLADVADDILDQIEEGSEEWKRIVQCGPTYVMGWDRSTDQYVYELPNDVPALFANRIAVEIAVFSGRLNIDAEDGDPMRLVTPKPIGR